jgi:hypothetical protein
VTMGGHDSIRVNSSSTDLSQPWLKLYRIVDLDNGVSCEINPTLTL